METSATLTSAGKTTQPGTRRPGSSCRADKFLTQVMEEPTRRGVLLDLVLTNKEGLVEDVKLGAASAAVTIKWWSSGSCMEKAGQ